MACTAAGRRRPERATVFHEKVFCCFSAHAVSRFAAADHPVLAADAGGGIPVACGRIGARHPRPQDGALPTCPSANHCVREDWPLADPIAALAQLQPVVAAMPGTRIETGAEPAATYLHATAESRLFGFIDDLELASDPDHGVLQVRSASRLGDSDLGVNRKRIELLREALLP